MSEVMFWQYLQRQGITTLVFFETTLFLEKNPSVRSLRLYFKSIQKGLAEFELWLLVATLLCAKTSSDTEITANMKVKRGKLWCWNWNAGCECVLGDVRIKRLKQEQQPLSKRTLLDQLWSTQQPLIISSRLGFIHRTYNFESLSIAKLDCSFLSPWSAHKIAWQWEQYQFFFAWSPVSCLGQYQGIQPHFPNPNTSSRQALYNFQKTIYSSAVRARYLHRDKFTNQTKHTTLSTEQ